MGQNGIKLFHSADMFNLGNQKDFSGSRFPVDIKVTSVHVGSGIPDSATSACIGIESKTDGSVKLLTRFDHGENESLSSGIKGVLDGTEFGLGKTGKWSGTTTFNGSEEVRQNGPCKCTMLHVGSNPVITGRAEDLSHIC